MTTATIRPITPSDEDTVAGLIEKHWGHRTVVSRGKVLDAARLPGFIACEGDTIVGLITIHPTPDGCEVVTIDAYQPGKGLGSRLLNEAAQFANV
jgi:predicted N-acetyltransferase YhbS